MFWPYCKNKPQPKPSRNTKKLHLHSLHFSVYIKSRMLHYSNSKLSFEKLIIIMDILKKLKQKFQVYIPCPASNYEGGNFRFSKQRYLTFNQLQLQNKEMILRVKRHHVTNTTHISIYYALDYSTALPLREAKYFLNSIQLQILLICMELFTFFSFGLIFVVVDSFAFVSFSLSNLATLNMK